MSAINFFFFFNIETKVLESPRNSKKNNVGQIIAAIKESRQCFDLAAMLGRASPSPAGGKSRILSLGWGSRAGLQSLRALLGEELGGSCKGVPGGA